MVRKASVLVGILLVSLLTFAVVTSGQGGPFIIIDESGRQELPVRRDNGRDVVPLDALATRFQVTLEEDRSTNALRLTAQGRVALLTPGESLASVDGRLVSLPAPLRRSGNGWTVPVEFVSQVLGPLSGQRIELRRPSRLIIVGNLRVPRVGMRYEAIPDGLRLVIDLGSDVPHAVVREPNRLLVAIEADALDEAIPPLPAQNLLEEVNVVGRNTLELALGPEFVSFRSAVAPESQGPGRVLLDLLGRPTAPPPATATAAPAANRFLPDSAPRTTIETVVIDPGHGGDDLGARGPTAVAEKDVTLAVARQLAEAIEARYGMRTLLTRSDDRWIGPDDRAALANNNKADLFLSLHANGSPQPTAHGVEVFYLSLDEYGDEARRDARLEGGRLPMFGGGTRNIELVPWDLAQGPYVDRSAVLATVVERQLQRRVRMSPYPTQQGPLRVLVGVNMPAVLVEMGYLSNPDDARALVSSPYQTLIVEALLDALDEFRQYLEAAPVPE